MGLAVLDVNLAVEVDVQVIRGLLGVRSTSKGQFVWLEVEFERLGWDIRSRNGQIDVVFRRIVSRRALGPENYARRTD